MQRGHPSKCPETSLETGVGRCCEVRRSSDWVLAQIVVESLARRKTSRLLLEARVYGQIGEMSQPRGG